MLVMYLLGLMGLIFFSFSVLICLIFLEFLIFCVFCFMYMSFFSDSVLELIFFFVFSTAESVLGLILMTIKVNFEGNDLIFDSV
uniref:NADH dehydrogenase subunit 4L n=1 Tax=Neoseiulus californicus TaxID=84382 RepID=UPI0022DCE190|nr:NADH dehydrogenase subunit 4L [Neoseiulus californicus]UZU69620.1 NADH dehydrogenase subunit 4L [Neoseiulus californicus]WJN56900.1 NADH dehydrogenase subunit 4L [Neoseiulus californicus]WKV28870.1 NADH dehydrogenase subunit 4L [Neoseiulus californicus]